MGDRYRCSRPRKSLFLSSTMNVDRNRYISDSNHDDIHVLFYHTFLSAIGHCALIALPRLYELPDLSDQSAENDDLGPRILKSLFQHMAWCISRIPAVRRPAGGTLLFVRLLFSSSLLKMVGVLTIYTCIEKEVEKKR